MKKPTERKRKSSKKPRAKLSLPAVLIIDDEEEQAAAAKLKLSGSASATCRLPSDVTTSDLNRANLVLVDFRLRVWPERDKLGTPSLMPRDGVALSATLKSNLRAAARTPTSFALHSGQLDDLSNGLSAARREHAIAKMLDLDWVFAKGQDPEHFALQVRSLAEAVSALPHPWPEAQNSRRALMKLLGIDRTLEWFGRAVDEVEKANPPQDVLARTTKGMAFVRWLLHDVLPFPGFLQEERYVAARMHVTVGSLRDALQMSGRSNLRSFLAESEYAGILNGFLGRRWWRAGLEHSLWRGTMGRPFERPALQALAQRLSKHLVSVDVAGPVVELDEQFRPTDTLIDPREAVQISPDDWPLSADPAWVRLEDAQKSPALAARVVAQDREKLEGLG